MNQLRRLTVKQRPSFLTHLAMRWVSTQYFRWTHKRWELMVTDQWFKVDQTDCARAPSTLTPRIFRKITTTVGRSANSGCRAPACGRSWAYMFGSPKMFPENRRSRTVDQVKKKLGPTQKHHASEQPRAFAILDKTILFCPQPGHDVRSRQFNS